MKWIPWSGNAIKNENKNVNKNSPFGSVFAIFFDLLIFRTEKIAWWPPAFKPDITYFPIRNNSKKVQEIVSYLLKMFSQFW